MSQSSRGTLWIVGLGPGAPGLLTPDAAAALAAAEVVVGYRGYLERVVDRLEGKEVVGSDLGQEVERAAVALDLAEAGRSVALVSGGDAGVYGMAGVACELAARRGSVAEVVVVPGVTAALAAAARLGAPLAHDWACVSLSDLLTPWETIRRRVVAAAAADFVLVLYNPASRARHWQLAAVAEVLREYRDPRTPVGLVEHASRPGERVEIVPLAELAAARVSMFTTVIVGSSRTFDAGGKMITPRIDEAKAAPPETIPRGEGPAQSLPLPAGERAGVRGAMVQRWPADRVGESGSRLLRGATPNPLPGGERGPEQTIASRAGADLFLPLPCGERAGLRGALRPEHEPSPAATASPGDRILAESLAVIERELGPHPADPAERAVVRRMIHASADFDYATTVRFGPGAIAAAIAALRRGAPIVADVEMLRAGIRRDLAEPLGVVAHCAIADPDGAALAEGLTRAAAAIRRAAARVGDGAVVAIGNAPTALAEALRRIEEHGWRPACVVGIPVGFVGVAEAKQRLVAQGRVPWITSPGRKGGTAVTAAAMNALLELAGRGP